MLRSNVNYGRTCICNQRNGRNNPDYVRNQKKYVRYEHIMIVVFFIRGDSNHRFHMMFHWLRVVRGNYFATQMDL